MPNNITKNHQAWNNIQKDFYNSRNHIRMWHVSDSLFVNNVLEQFISFSGLQKNQHILEIGCGAGRYSIPLIQMGYKVTGIDISQKMINKFNDDAVKLNLSKAKYRLICKEFDTYHVVESERFDAVIGFNVLHHLYDVLACFNTIKQNIKGGSLVVFLEPNNANPLHMIDTLLDRGWKAEKNKSASTPKNVDQAMKSCNIEKVEFKHFGFFPPFMIDGIPGLLKCEKSIEKMKLIKKFLPYFIIKGINNKSG